MPDEESDDQVEMIDPRSMVYRVVQHEEGEVSLSSSPEPEVVEVSPPRRRRVEYSGPSAAGGSNNGGNGGSLRTGIEPAARCVQGCRLVAHIFARHLNVAISLFRTFTRGVG